MSTKITLIVLVERKSRKVTILHNVAKNESVGSLEQQFGNLDLY